MPFIKPINFLSVRSGAGQTIIVSIDAVARSQGRNGSQTRRAHTLLPAVLRSPAFQFGIWTNCGRLTPSASYGCQTNSLGYTSPNFRPLVQNVIGNNLPTGLIVQPISALLAALATLGAFFNLCGFTIFWVLLAVLAFAASVAALAIELALFVPVKNRFDNGNYDVNAANSAFAGGAALSGGADYSTIASTMLGPAIWMQVGAVVAALIGLLFLIVGYAINRRRARRDRDDAAFDFQTANNGNHHNGGYGDETYDSTMVAGTANNTPNEKRRSKRWTMFGGKNAQYETPGSYDDEGYYVPDGGQAYEQQQRNVAGGQNPQHVQIAQQQQQYAQALETQQAQSVYTHSASQHTGQSHYYDAQGSGTGHTAESYGMQSSSHHGVPLTAAAAHPGSSSSPAPGADPRYDYGNYPPHQAQYPAVPSAHTHGGYDESARHAQAGQAQQRW